MRTQRNTRSQYQALENMSDQGAIIIGFGFGCDLVELVAQMF